MPTIKFKAVTPEQAVRSVCAAVMSDLTSVFTIPDHTVFYSEEIRQSTQTTDTVDKKTSKANLTAYRLQKLDSAGGVYVEITQEYDVENRNVNGILGRGDRVFFETDVGVAGKLISVPFTINMSITIATPSKQSAITVVDNVHLMRNVDSSYRTHNLPFRTYLGRGASAFINEVRTMANPTETIEEYLTNTTKGLSVSSHLEGTITELSVEYTQVASNGLITDTPTSIEFDETKGLYVVTLGYRLTLHKPIMTMFEYPVVINNAVVRDWLLKDQLAYVDQYCKVYGNEITAAELQAAPRNVMISSADYITRVPAFDFSDINKLHSYITYPIRISILVEDDSALFSFDALGEVEIDADILAFLKSEAEYVTKPGDSIFHLAHFVNEQAVVIDSIQMDNTGTVRSTKQFTKRKRHKICLGLITDPMYLTDAAKERLFNSKTVLSKLVDTLNHMMQLDPMEFNRKNIIYTIWDFDPKNRTRLPGMVYDPVHGYIPHTSTRIPPQRVMRTVGKPMLSVYRKHIQDRGSYVSNS